MATIKDIATRLGVSVSTVSKGLNGASDISEELRQMVLDTAVEMGYATKNQRKKKTANWRFLSKIWNMKRKISLATISYSVSNRMLSAIIGMSPLFRSHLLFSLQKNMIHTC